MQLYKNVGVVANGPYAAAQIKFDFRGTPADLPQYLVAVEIGIDENNHVPSSQLFVDMALGDKNDSNRTYVNLKQDNVAPYGQAHWAGCIPIDDRMILIAQLYGVNTGDTYYINYILNDKPVHNSDVGHNAVGVYELGRATVVSQDGAAGVDTISVRPPQYRRWRVEKLYGFHNDTTNKVAQWLLSDGVTSVELNSAAALAGASYLQLLDANMPFLIVSYDCFLQFKVTALGGTKIASARGTVLEYGWDTR